MKESERMEGYKKGLFTQKSVKYFLNEVNISDINMRIEEEIIEKQIPAADAEDKIWEGFIEESKEIKKILAIHHTVLDLFFFFSDYFPDDANVEETHKERVKKYAQLLNLKKKINDTYIEKLEGVIKDYEKVIIVVPMFPNISVQSFSILSELGWLKELIIDKETNSIREKVDIHILFLNKPFLNILDHVDKEKRKYFCDYRTTEKNRVKSVLDLNKIRIESFIKRYLTEFIVNEINEKEKNMAIAQWLCKHVKTIDERASVKSFWEDIKIEMTEENVTEENVVDELTECDGDTLGDINLALSNSTSEAEKCYCLSDVGVPKLLGFKPQQNEEAQKEKATYKNILHYLRKVSENNENTLIINVHTFKAVVLFGFYINKIIESGKGKTKFMGWDSYIPMIEPPIIPIFQYLSTISKSYNFSVAKMYEDIVYNHDERNGKYTICYLAHLLEFLFEDVIRTFGMRVGGPKCDKEENGKKCGGDTILVKKKCTKCGTEHWMFGCTSCSRWDAPDSPRGTLADYLWLPMEIYYELEKVFLDIPYTFMLTKREYTPRESGESGDENQIEDDVKKEFENTFEKQIIGAIGELKEHFEEQEKYLRVYLSGEIDKIEKK